MTAVSKHSQRMNQFTHNSHLGRIAMALSAMDAISHSETVTKDAKIIAKNISTVIKRLQDEIIKYRVNIDGTIVTPKWSNR